MKWALQYLDRRQARIVDAASGRPLSGYLDWMTAAAIVDAHNRAIERS